MGSNNVQAVCSATKAISMFSGAPGGQVSKYVPGFSTWTVEMPVLRETLAKAGGNPKDAKDIVKQAYNHMETPLGISLFSGGKYYGSISDEEHSKTCSIYPQ